MNRSLTSVFLLVFLAAGCAKDKSKNAVPSTMADALSSNDQCAMMNCQKAKKPGAPVVATPADTATDTTVDTTTDTSTVPAPSPVTPAPIPEPAPAPAPVKPAPVKPNPTSPPAKPLPKPLPGPPKPAPAPVDDSDLALQQAKAMNALLACQHNDCDASVGLLTVVLKIPQEGWIVGQCTASLVGPDILATNGHCIPADLVAAGSNCDGRMWITFAKDPAHPEYDKQIGCSSVLFRRKDGGLEGADYAYLKLAHASNRPVLRQSQAGFEDQKVYHLHKINPGELEGGMMGELVKVDCLSMYDSAIFPERLDRLSQTSLLVDCPVLKGNSGSPILADDGTIHGVIYSFVTNAVARQVLDKNGSSLPSIENIADLNLGSNFACLTLPGDPDGRSLPPACANSLEHLARARAAAQNLVAKAIHGSVQAQISAHAAGHPDALAFGWTSTTSNSGAMGTVAQAVPECVNHTAATGFLNRNGKVHRAFFFVKATYDKYLRASNYVPTWQGFAKTAEDMQLTQAADSSFQLDITSSTSGQAEFNASLPACGAPVAHR